MCRQEEDECCTQKSPGGWAFHNTRIHDQEKQIQQEQSLFLCSLDEQHCRLECDWPCWLRMLSRSRSSLTERSTRSRSAAFEMSWAPRRSWSRSCRSKCQHGEPPVEPPRCLMPPLTCAQPEPEDHAGAREATGGAREAEDGGAGEEPPAAGTHVTFAHTAQPGSLHTHKHARQDLNMSAGCSWTGGSRPSRTWRAWRRLWSVALFTDSILLHLNVSFFSIGKVFKDSAAASQYVSRYRTGAAFSSSSPISGRVPLYQGCFLLKAIFSLFSSSLFFFRFKILQDVLYQGWRLMLIIND